MLQQRSDCAFERAGNEISGDQKKSIRAGSLKCPQHDGQALGLALVAEGSDQQRLRRKAQGLAKAHGLPGRRQDGPLEQVRDLEHSRARGMFENHRRGSGIMYDDRARGRGDALKHGSGEVARVGAGSGAFLPQSAARFGVAVVVDELFDIFVGAQHPQHQVLQHRVMQDYHAGMSDRPPVDMAVQSIVAYMVQGDIARLGRNLDGSAAPQER